MRLPIPLMPIEIVVQRRERRFKVRVRDLMILVLFVAIGIYAWQDDARRERYRTLARNHTQGVARASSLHLNLSYRAESLEEKAVNCDVQAAESTLGGDLEGASRLAREAVDYRIVATNMRSELPSLARQLSYHTSLMQKYKVAVVRPWRPLWPDPSEP